VKALYIVSGLIVLAVIVLACTIPRTPTLQNIEAINESLVYFQDVHGICYASITSHANGVSYVVSIATVPCKDVGL
jgi:hypothetical protein